MSARFQRYVDSLSDEDALTLHRIVCRRAARIYEPLTRSKREANFRTAMSLQRAIVPSPSRSSST